MSAFAAVQRATLLYPSAPAHDPTRNHLFIVLTDPWGSAAQVLLTCVCSIRSPQHDPTCILNVGDHPFVVRPSYVYYRDCRVEPASKLANGVASGYFVDRGLIDLVVFERVLAGVRASRFSKPFAIEFLRDCGL